MEDQLLPKIMKIGIQDNGFDESKEVYIDGNNLEEGGKVSQGVVTIGELGFGLGLNFNYDALLVEEREVL